MEFRICNGILLQTFAAGSLKAHEPKFDEPKGTSRRFSLVERVERAATAGVSGSELGNDPVDPIVHYTNRTSNFNI